MVRGFCDFALGYRWLFGRICILVGCLVLHFGFWFGCFDLMLFCFVVCLLILVCYLHGLFLVLGVA